MTKTVIGTYRDMDSAVAVVNALVDAGFDRNNISLISNNADNRYSTYIDSRPETNDVAKGAGIGAAIGGIGGLLVGLGALAIPGIGPIIAAGPIAAALAGAGIGAVTGGMIGALVDLGIPEEEAHVYAESVRRGSVLVAAQVSEDRVSEVSSIMERPGLIDIERHAEDWRAGGWKSFDATDTYPGGTHVGNGIRDGNGHTDSQSEFGSPSRHDALNQNVSHIGATTDIGLVRENTTFENHSPQPGNVRVRTYTNQRSSADPIPAGQADFSSTSPSSIAAARAEASRPDASRNDASRNDASVVTMDYPTYDIFDPDFRTHYQTTYAQLGAGYEVYQPAYRYGYTLATDDRYRNHNWSEVEPEVRRAWETRNEGTWESFKDAVEHSWDKVRGRA
jgi:uncharacterized membrane protein